MQALSLNGKSFVGLKKKKILFKYHTLALLIIKCFEGLTCLSFML